MSQNILVLPRNNTPTFTNGIDFHAQFGQERNSLFLYRFGEGDWGVIVTGQIDIDARLYNRGNIVIGKEHQPIPGDLRFERLKQAAAAATAHGSLILGQIVHVGRQVDARVSAETISASPIPLGMSL